MFTCMCAWSTTSACFFQTSIQTKAVPFRSSKENTTDINPKYNKTLFTVMPVTGIF